MPKDGELSYLQNLGEDGRRHCAAKPFSDEHCPRNLEDFAAILQLLPPPPARVLDLGCGMGWTSRFFARRGYDVTGVDLAPDMVAEAVALAGREQLGNVAFVASDYEELAYRDEFDAAVFFDSLHHAVDEGLAVRQAFRALRPGGVCVTHEPGLGHAVAVGSVEAVAKYGVTEKDMHPEKIIALGRDAGFRRFGVFPAPRENGVVPYTFDAAAETRAAAPPPDPMSVTGWWGRWLHRITRRHLRLSPRAYATFGRTLPRIREMCEWDGGYGLLLRTALVVMQK